MVMWNPSVEIESAGGIRETSLRTHLLMQRKIMLNGEINSDIAEIFHEQMIYMQEEKEPVSVIIDSPGGEIDAGLLIYDIIQGSTIPVNLYCAGRAYSMAAIILASGKPGHRFILPHSKVMIHEPLIQSRMVETATSIQNISKSILETRDISNGLLAKHTGKDLKEINQITMTDKYMGAEEAVRFGICDKIVDRICI